MAKKDKAEGLFFSARKIHATQHTPEHVTITAFPSDATRAQYLERHGGLAQPIKYSAVCASMLPWTSKKLYKGGKTIAELFEIEEPDIELEKQEDEPEVEDVPETGPEPVKEPVTRSEPTANYARIRKPDGKVIPKMGIEKAEALAQEDGYEIEKTF